MQGQKKSQKDIFKKYIVPIFAVLFIVCVLQMLMARRETNFVELKAEDGILDIRSIDFENEIYTIANDWNFYPNALYTSADFVEQMPKDSEESPNAFSYGTHRLVLHAKPHTYYTMCGYSIDYASQIFVNGSKVVSFGTIADTKENSVAKTGYQTIPIYTGEDGIVEIICQYNNFVHHEGGTIHMTYFSTPQNIENYKISHAVVSITLGGGLFLLSLYYLLYASIQKQKSYLALAFCCLIFALRDQFFAFISLFPPELPWNISYRIYIAVVNLLPVAILLLLFAVFSLGKKEIAWTYIGVKSIFFILIFSLHTKALPNVNMISYFFDLPYFLYLVIQLIKYIRSKKPLPSSDMVSLLGFATLVLALLLEGCFILFSNINAVRYGLTPTAMLLFIFLIAFSIRLKMQEKEIALAESQNRIEMLQKMNEAHLDFLHKVAHELKTPLTVISGYAQLTDMQIRADKTDDETYQNLHTIHEEALRLADMVNQLSQYSKGQKDTIQFENFSSFTLLEKAKAVCQPICQKNQNDLNIAGVSFPIHANLQLLLQVLLNLIVNANKHTHDGAIWIRSIPSDTENMVLFLVEDSGEGIAENHVAHLFESGFSPDDSNGLGLPISKEIVELHGGKIWVKETGPKGTTIAFTIPKAEE